MRFEACRLAKCDWILLLHSDEVVDEELQKSLRRFDHTGIKQVYRIQFKNYFGNFLDRCHGESAGIRIYGLQTGMELKLMANQYMKNFFNNRGY